MPEDELRAYDKLLDVPDWDTYYWATGKRDPHPDWKDSSVLKKMQEHAKNEGKNVLRMPDLDLE